MPAKRPSKSTAAASAAAAGTKPLINLRLYQAAVFRHQLRRLYLLWARQRGKSYTLACESLDMQMEMPGCLVTFISASIVLGTEILLKEATVWLNMLDTLRKAAAAADMKLTSNVDDLDLDAVCDVFEHSKLETKLWHSNTICSRSRVIAPNESTAVGWTGHIIGDEITRWPNAREVLEAILPFMDSNPRFRLRLAGTPPPDDKHYSYELFVPPADAEFPVNAQGNWYQAPSGIRCHRVSVWDGAAAGVTLYHPDTGVPIGPDQHRALAADKTAWDRNYALMFLQGGTAAVSLNALARAMGVGAGVCLGVNVTEAVEA